MSCASMCKMYNLPFNIQVELELHWPSFSHMIDGLPTSLYPISHFTLAVWFTCVSLSKSIFACSIVWFFGHSEMRINQHRCKYKCDGHSVKPYATGHVNNLNACDSKLTIQMTLAIAIFTDIVLSGK